MTRPPSRGGAESVKFTGGSRPASMQVLDVDNEDPKVKRDAWFTYVMPVQTGVQMVPTLRYGYWEERPKVAYEQGAGIVRVDGGVDEPILVATVTNEHVIFVAKAEHIEAQPFPELRETEQPGGPQAA